MPTLREMLQATIPQPINDVDAFLSENEQRFQGPQPVVANAFRTLQNERNGLFSDIQNNLIGLHSALDQTITQNPSFNRFLNESLQQGRQSLGQLREQGDRAREFFAPNGSFQQGVDRFFGGAGQFLQNRAASNQAAALNDALRSGASLGAARAAQSSQGAQDFQNFLNLQEQRIQQQQNAFNSLNQLLNQIQQQEAQTRQNFIINPFLELSNRQQQVGTSLLDGLSAIESQRLALAAARAAQQGSGTSSQQTQQSTPVRVASTSVTAPGTVIGTDGKLYRVDANNNLIPVN